MIPLNASRHNSSAKYASDLCWQASVAGRLFFLRFLTFCGLILIFAAQFHPLLSDSVSLLPEPVSSQKLKVLSPGVVEWRWVESGEMAKSGSGSFSRVPLKSEVFADQHSFSADEFELEIRPADQGAWERLSIQSVGFRRRAAFAAKNQLDLRIEVALIFQTDIGPSWTLDEDWEIQLTKAPAALAALLGSQSQPSSGSKGNSTRQLIQPDRVSPMIHISSEGYDTLGPKFARLGYFLGSLGEWKPASALDNIPFTVLKNTDNGTISVLEGIWKLRVDDGFDGQPAPYQTTWIADFSSLEQPGSYCLATPGLGRSDWFEIDDSVSARVARTLALGLFHQRCGMAHEAPWTRFVHGRCHFAPATIPQPGDALAARHDRYISEADGSSDDGMDSFEGSFFPIEKQFKVDVSQGHHDAGDYSKYVINSAQLIHHLTFVADSFPGADQWDSAGIPESGDGKGDLYQEAQWEADFLMKAQDLDGGFFFLVYPERRKYEDDVLPDPGDPQVVWPKNTAATAAATAALAQLGSSPGFRAIEPQKAEQYMQAAHKGWDFLVRAVDQYGWRLAYQRITHYGDVFEDQDEMIWAATEMSIATQDPAILERLQEWAPNFSGRDLRRWGWWRLYEGYGCAIRSWAFAPTQGKANTQSLDPGRFNAAKQEIELGAFDAWQRSRSSAYGISLPVETKRQGSVGWFFPSSVAFDLAVGCALAGPEASEPYLQALVENLNYELGLNPHHVTFIAGLGRRRPTDIVSQFDQNQPRQAPPTGILSGAVASGFSWLEPYGRDLEGVAFPPYGSSADEITLHPMYDRWTDVFNTTAESTVIEQARALGSWMFLAMMAESGNEEEPTSPYPGPLTGLITSQTPGVGGVSAAADFQAPAVGSKATLVWKWDDSIKTAIPDKLAGANVVWETSEGDFVLSGTEWNWTRRNYDAGWIEAEVCLKNGWRAFQRVEFPALNRPPKVTLQCPDTIVFPNSVLRPVAILQDESTQLSPSQMANRGLSRPQLEWKVRGVSPSPLFLDQYTTQPFIHFRAPGNYLIEVTVVDGMFTVEAQQEIRVLAPAPWDAVSIAAVESELQILDSVIPDKTLELIKSRRFDLDDTDAQLTGDTRWTIENRPWAKNALQHIRHEAGQSDWTVIRASDLEDTAIWRLDQAWLEGSLDDPGQTVLEIAVWTMIRDWKGYGETNATLLGFIQEWDSKIEWMDPKWGKPPGSQFQAGDGNLELNEAAFTSTGELIPRQTWGWLRIFWQPGGMTKVYWNGTLIASGPGARSAQRDGSWEFKLGAADADFADPALIIWKISAP